MAEPVNLPAMTASSLPKANGTLKDATNGVKPVVPVPRNRNKRSMDYEPEDYDREFKRRDTQLLGAKGLQRVRFVLLDEQGQQTKRIHIFKFLSDKHKDTANNDEAKFDFSRFEFERMLQVIGVEEETARELQYSALLPCGHVIDVSTSKGWRRAIKDLDGWMSRLFVAEEAKPVILGPGRYVVREDTPEPEEEVKDGSKVDLQMPLATSSTMFRDGTGRIEDLDPKRWSRACEFFCHPSDDERGVKVPGVGVRLPPKIMCDLILALGIYEDDLSSLELSKMGLVEHYCLVAIRSLCCTVSDICSATHSNLNDADISAFEQDYHIQCHCRSQSLKKVNTLESKRGLHAVVTVSVDEMEGAVRDIEKLFNDELSEMFKHCMFPMTLKDGKLTNIFPDYGVDPLGILAQQGFDKELGGLERVIILGTDDMNHRKLWRAAFPAEPVPLDLDECFDRYPDFISDLFIMERAKGLH